MRVLITAAGVYGLLDGNKNVDNGAVGIWAMRYARHLAEAIALGCCWCLKVIATMLHELDDLGTLVCRVAESRMKADWQAAASDLQSRLGLVVQLLQIR